MKCRLFHNAKGVTLVELLAALSLFAIVLALASGTIFHLFKGESESNQKIVATRQANLAIQDLKDQYSSGNDKICLNSAENLVSINQTSNGEINGDCIQGIDSKEPMSITLTSLPESGQPLTISTTWTNKTGKEIGVRLVEKDTHDVIIDDDYITKNGCELDDPNANFIYTLPSLDTGCTFNANNGVFPNDIEFYKNTGKDFGKATITVKGNVTFNGELSFGSANPQDDELVIKGDAVFSDIVFDKNQTEIVVNGNATFLGDILMKNNPQSSLYIQENATCQNILLGTNMTINDSKSCSAP